MITQQQQDKLLSALLKKPQNALCADCNSKSPCWASLDFGVFVCMNCSGAHRSLGQSVTRIKSTKLDTWNRDWIWHMQLNNIQINQYFEANINAVLHKKPNPNTSLIDIKKFVTDKYVRRLYALQGQDDPITNLKNGKQPFKQPQVEQQKPQLNTNHNNVKQVNKPIKSLIDDDSEYTMKPKSEKQKSVNLIHLFEEFQQIKNVNMTPSQHFFNREHFNSFSGNGAVHSSTSQIKYADIFHSDQKKNHQHQNQLNQHQKFDFGQTTQQISAHYSHIPYQNGYQTNHHYFQMTPQLAQQQQFHNTKPGFLSMNTQPTHVTMNINMNLYGNVGSINLKDTPKEPANIVSQPNDVIKLDLKDFDFGTKKVKQESTQKQKSWADDWR